MKILKVAMVTTAFVVTVGCNRDSDTTYSSNDTSQQSQNGPRSEMSTNDNRLTPTSDQGTPNRVYSPDAKTEVKTTDNSLKEPDNTGKNERDRSNDTLTPGDQSNNKADLEITKNIRQGINDKSEMSTLAKNIKIITVNGKVILRGPVKSDEELKAIVSMAQGMAGVSSVDNQLEVKTQ